jgi:hypothetical protein
MRLREAYRLMMIHRKSARHHDIVLDNTSEMTNNRESVKESYGAFEELLPRVDPKQCGWHLRVQPIKMPNEVIEIPKLISLAYNGIVCLKVKYPNQPQYNIDNRSDVVITHIKDKVFEDDFLEIKDERKLILGIELMISFYGLVLSRPHEGRNWGYFDIYRNEGATLMDLVERTKEISPVK